MTLNEIFFPGGKQHIVRLKSRDMEGTVKEIVDALQANGRLAAATVPIALKALIEREQVSSTGIGSGIAIPHARIDAIPDIVGLVGVSKEGVNFHAIDGQPVHALLLVLSPKSAQSAHLNTLANISQFVRSEKFQNFMKRLVDDGEIEDFT